MLKLKDKRVTVLGLGRFGGGIAVARWLVGQGAAVRVVDRDGPDKLADSVRQLADLPIDFRLGSEEVASVLESDLIVASPAVAPAHPLLLAAKAAAVPVTTEICLFVDRCPTQQTIGVTGTKGKSTTTALLGLMLSAARQPASATMTWKEPPGSVIPGGAGGGARGRGSGAKRGAGNGSLAGGVGSQPGFAAGGRQSSLGQSPSHAAVSSGTRPRPATRLTVLPGTRPAGRDDAKAELRDIVDAASARRASLKAAAVAFSQASGRESSAFPVSPRVFVGGNIGVSLLDQLPQITPADVVLLELSSFMLWHLGRARWSPHVALITMVDSDHLDWHASQEAYLEAKQNIVRYQTERDFCVVSTDSKTSRAFGKLSRGTVVEYGKRANLPAAFAPRLPGKHNRTNERGAYAAARLFGVYPDEAAAAVADFAGLPHRLQAVHGADGVTWIDDSVATVPEAAAAACRAFAAGKVVQIVGGHDKGLDLSPLVEALSARAKAVLCIGEAGPTLAAAIGQKASNCQTLQRAVAGAREIAAAGDVVLLSPGCSSYDQFVNFEERGKTFARLAKGEQLAAEDKSA